MPSYRFVCECRRVHELIVENDQIFAPLDEFDHEWSGREGKNPTIQHDTGMIPARRLKHTVVKTKTRPKKTKRRVGAEHRKLVECSKGCGRAFNWAPSRTRHEGTCRGGK